jgi:hypothetical protein
LTIRRLTCLILLYCLALPAMAALQASVDRTRLVEGETLELTLESSAGGRMSRPDFSPLDEHFDVQGSRQLSLVSQIEGRSQPVTRWIITLMPKRTGFVVVPPIDLDGVRSDPITLQVLSASQAARDTVAQMSPVFIDSEVDTESPYVQAQVLLTLRVYHSVSLYDDSTLSGLTIPDARVVTLGKPRNYERLINGVRHGVIEVRYALFPQKSGAIEIPSQLFSATILQPREPNERFSARAGRLVQVRSPSILLDVRPVPAEYPPGAPWIPTPALQLEQRWQPDPGVDLLAGEPLTRTLVIQAEGLHAAQLPTLQGPENLPRNLRQYADQPRLDDQLEDNGVRGVREESAALVAQNEGSFALPPLAVHWWNTATDRLEVSSLAPVTLSITGDEGYMTPTAAVSAATLEPADNALLWPWQLACLLLTIALGVSLLQLRRTRLALRLSLMPEEQEHLDEVDLGNPLGDLQLACRANQPAEARKALEAWARQQDPEGLIGLAQKHPELAEALDELNASLFGQSDAPWRGKPLWRAVRMTIQNRKRGDGLPADHLASLYPET